MNYHKPFYQISIEWTGWNGLIKAVVVTIMLLHVHKILSNLNVFNWTRTPKPSSSWHPKNVKPWKGVKLPETMGRNFVLSTLRIVQRNQLVNFRFHNIPMELLILQYPIQCMEFWGSYQWCNWMSSHAKGTLRILVSEKFVKDWHNQLSNQDIFAVKSFTWTWSLGMRNSNFTETSQTWISNII